MFVLDIPSDVFLEIESANKQSPSVGKKLIQLGTTPLANAIATNIPTIGKYYINAGRWCILFDLMEDGETIHIYKIVLSAFLHKILTGRISPTTSHR